MRSIYRGKKFLVKVTSSQMATTNSFVQVWQLFFKTSQIKKRKLSPQALGTQDIKIGSKEILITSAKDIDSQISHENQLFGISVKSDSELPSSILEHTQNHTEFLEAPIHILEVASSPSLVKADLSFEVVRESDSNILELQKFSSAREEDSRDKIPNQNFKHHSLMDDTVVGSQRSSSPLKRRASDLENETIPPYQKDVDMISVSSSTSPRSEKLMVKSCQDDEEKPAENLPEVVTDEIMSPIMIAPQQKPLPNIAGTGKDSFRFLELNTDDISEIPDINTQVKTISSIIKAESEQYVKEGDKIYLISNNWLQSFEERRTENIKMTERNPPGNLGPIDNSDIILQIIKDINGVDFVQLKPGLGFDDFTLVPESAWNLLVEWYGISPGTAPILRVAHNTNPHGNSNINYEFYPLIFKIFRLTRTNSVKVVPQKSKSTTSDTAPTLILSKSTKWVDFLKLVKSSTMVDLQTRIRVWRLPGLKPAIPPLAHVVNSTPPPSRPGSPTSTTTVSPLESLESWNKLLLDVSKFLELEVSIARELIEVDDVSIDSKYNGSRDLSMVGLGQDQIIVLEEYTDANKTWISDTNSKNGKFTSATTARSKTSIKTHTASSHKTQARSGALMTRGRAQKSGRTPGTVGLSNLGNTCYMNSALQCIRAVEELTKYFLAGSAMEELNCDNPLGNNGQVAVAYQKLLEEIYHRETVPISVTPRYFRNTIGRCAPSFSGYGQQDSQEFLGFLLDGLQEDLSRVKKKPYIEKPDSTDDMVNNPEAIKQMADKVWDITKKRDDSIIADLFTGIYKSTLICPNCEKVSITFDPFNNLTLQLPIESIWSHDLFYFPLNERPFIMTVEIDKQGSILALKQYVSSRVGVPVQKLFVAEELKFRFFKYFKDNEIASEQIKSSDHLTVYELDNSPTNWPLPKRLKQKSSSSYGSTELYNLPCWNDPISKCMVVPVIHRHSEIDSSVRNGHKNNKGQWLIKCAPHMITLTPDEARSEDTIRRKILEKVATFTTSAEFKEDLAETTCLEDISNSDLVSTGDLETATSGENKTINPIEDQADVTMNDDCASADPQVVTQSQRQSSPVPRGKKVLFQSKNCRPKWIDPSTYLKPELQNLFEINYFRSTNGLMPSDWSSFDSQKTYPKISSRINQSSLVLDGESDQNDSSDNHSAGSESSEDDSKKLPSSTCINDGSHSDDDGKSTNLTQQALPLRTADSNTRAVKVANRNNNRNKTSTKKTKSKNVDLMMSGDRSLDDGPLIRLGETIIVDWNPQAYDAFFCGDGSDNRGQSTWDKMPSQKDDILAEKRELRLKSKKKGISLDDCLDEFGREETLSEMDTWYCPRCKEHQRASKKLELWKTPDILIMHLKRFSSSARRRDKLDIRVDFPVEGLDLTSRVIMKTEDKKEIYDLIAVDNHWGGLGGGHYTAHAKNFYNCEWYEYNDSSVSKPKALSEIVSESAYLLFYRRRSDLPLGGPKLRKIIEEYDNRASFSEDEVADPGEDQALVGDSSLHGSSSAFIEAGAVHHRLRGFDSAEGTASTSNSERVHSSSPQEDNEENEDDSYHLLGSQTNRELQESIEDEGFSEGDDGTISFNMDLSKNNLSYGFASDEWNLSGLNKSRRNIPSSVGSGEDLSSERGQCDSSPSQISNNDTYSYFEDVCIKDNDESFIDEEPPITATDDNQAVATAKNNDIHLEQLKKTKID
ncbi:hypothetical protein Golomagni_02447 [Golovinomyces magnicellulatus]|nr:hypothetical protein Golomagni_02447 [Golovinomyces magnicellulatus]